MNQQSPFGTLRSAASFGTQACVTTANEPAPLVTTVQAVSGIGTTYVGPGQLVRWLGVSNVTGNINDPAGLGDVIGKGATYQAGPVTNVCSPLSALAQWAMIGVPLKPAY